MRGNTRRSWLPTSSSSVLLVSLAACFLAGCALARAPRQSQVLTKSLPNGTSIPPVWNSNTNADAVANDWLKSFNDPKLDAIVAEAIQNNLDLRYAAAAVEMARQEVALVGSQLKPQLGGQLGAATTHDFSRSSFPTATWNMLYRRGRQTSGDGCGLSARPHKRGLKLRVSITPLLGNPSRQPRLTTGISRLKPASSFGWPNRASKSTRHC